MLSKLTNIDMKIKEVIECERNEFEKLKKYQLSNSFKKVGWAIVILSFIVFLIRKFYFEDLEIVKSLAENAMLIGFLIVVISKEKIEDELISKIRGQAFSFAFIAGVVYAIVMPFTNYAMDFIINTKEAVYSDLGDFIIIWFMMVVYLAFFMVLKRTR